MQAWLFLMCLVASGCWLIYDGLTLARWRSRGGYTWIGSNYKRVIRILFGLLLIYLAIVFGRNIIGG
jgi:threonine/homoserine/homoserine lactone efflux protein